MWNSLTTRAADIIVQLKPAVAIFENVLTARTNDSWTRAIARLNANGYHSVSVCLDACKMSINVPQTRKTAVRCALSNEWARSDRRTQNERLAGRVQDDDAFAQCHFN